MKKGQKSPQNCIVKMQNNIQVFFSEKLQVFYVKEKGNHLPNDHFTSLITCRNEFFNDFLKHLEQFKTSANPMKFNYTDLKDKLNEFLMGKAANCKVIGNIEINKAS
ncbi:hypothetical protein [Tenacibaculum caenipelagi]|uniref:Uncharacterized protein n=1 Tax=Tenacibaculum caenipelagi TaxID=1325435 RepID=A0A4R6TAH5_9FLAO|nr:hypothetical protein [Tenacibaculum caenipelagi]TDQ22778.1 hypothetical protein DFQ07_2796 [Tenacibaculum caenipelagi]